MDEWVMDEDGLGMTHIPTGATIYLQANGVGEDEWYLMFDPGVPTDGDEGESIIQNGSRQYIFNLFHVLAAKHVTLRWVEMSYDEA